jgi:hypothetical protein
LPVPPSGVIPTSLAQVPARSQKSAGCQFRVSPRYLLCGVAFPGGGTTGVGVDERVEGASGRLTSCSVLLEVDQVEQAAPPVCPLVEPHLSVASFDDLNEASEEVEALRTVFPLGATSVDFHGGWLVHTFLLGAKVRLGRRGGKPQPNPAVTKTLSPWWPETVKHWRTLH